MKRENNKKFKKRRRNQNRSLTCRVLSMMFAIVLFCSTVLINTNYVSQASSFDDMVDMVAVEEDSAAVGISEETGDDLDTDVNFESEESSDETYSESDDLGSGDADFSSGENMFTDGTSESSGNAPTEEAAQPVSCIVNLKNETIEIKAEAPAGVLPNGTQMIVEAVENNTEDAEMTDQYNKLAAKITEQLQSQGKNLDGFLAYNVSFTDADGNPVEPSDKVTYSFTYKEASSPELTDPAASTVTAAMIRTNKETSELELTELKAEEDKLTVETNESKQLTKAAFQSAATAAYTFVWSSTPAADDNENNENKEENSEVNNEEVNTDTNTENTEENGEVNNEEVNTDTNTENTEENGEETPDQEQTKMIRIIADEVNLRVAPSTEAEAIATVDTDTQLPLLETVTGEDEFTWYKVSYDETEAYVRSDMAEVVETEEQGTENEDANEEAEVQVEDEVTYSQKIDNVVVNATASKGVLPDDAQFVVTPIKSEDEQYEDIAARLEEKAENEEYSIAGFLAYDIYFLNSAGEKINPEDGKVKISMEYQNATAPEEVKESDAVQMDAEEEETSQENTEAKELSISVMHFVEENGEVQNIVNMTQEGQASVKTTDDGQIQNAEFNTGSFSVFTITWTQKRQGLNGGETEVGIECVDTNGNVINVSELSKVRATKDTVIRLSDYEPYISGYGFVRAQIGGSPYANNYAELKLIKAVQSNSAWTYSYLDDTSYTADTKWNEWTSGTPTVYLVYTPTELSIQDDLTGTGNLIPVLTDNMKALVANAKEKGNEVSYIWEKSINNGDFQAVNKVKVSGDNYNITTNEDGVDCLNVALDKGALSSSQSSVKYKVSIKIGDELKSTSGEYSVRYYKELYNGDFEIPEVAQNHSDTNNWQYSNENYKAQGGVWQSTGTMDTNPPYCDTDGADIEIVTTATKNLSGYKWYGTVCDADGDAGQFAELNCQAAGALYQDVITYSGEKLSFSLNHRARGNYANSTPEYDTMYVVIMPTNKAEGLTTQTSLENFIKDQTGKSCADQYTTEETKDIEFLTTKDEDVLIGRVTSDDQDWHYISAIEQYVAKSNMTRFFFVAGATASGKNTVGNFLDNVQFTQNLPPANPGTFTLKVEKKVVGLEPSAVLKHNMQFTIKAYNQDGSEAKNAPLNRKSFRLDEMTYDEDGHVYSKLFTNQNIGANENYIYKVEETGSQVSTHTVATTQTVSGGKVQTDPDKVSTLIGERDSVTFKITNTYTPIDINSVIEYNKTATLLDWNQRTYKIDLTASSKTTQSMKIPYDIVLVLDQSGSMSQNFVEYKKIDGSMSGLWGNTYYIKTQNGIYQKLYKESIGTWGNPKYKWSYKDSYTDKWVTIDPNATDVYEAKTSTQTKLSALKSAASRFVDNVAKKNSDCRIGIVTFSNNGDIKSITKKGYTLAKVGTSEKDIINTINSLSTGGDTYPAAGLDKAREVFSEKSSQSWEAVDQTDGRRKMVVFLTDGVPAPADTDDFSEKLAKAGTDSATQLHNLGAETYALGIFGAADSNGTMNTASVKRIDAYMQSIASSHEKYMTADSVDNLSSLFESITNNIPVTATVTDVIDSRFELTPESREALKGEATITSNDGFTTITWNNASITGKKASGETEIERAGWHRSIVIKAKDNYIGGNDVPTNGAGSGIDVDNNHAEFPQPTVNVKVDFNIGSNETVIFKGDDLSEHFTDNIENEITKLEPTTGVEEYTICNDVDVSINWYTNADCTTKIEPDEIRAEKPTADTVYYAKVTVTPKTNGSASSANSVGDGKADGGYYKVDSAGVAKTGTYTVRVVSGQIQITKKIDVAFDEDQSFTFEIKKGDKLIATASAEIPKGSTNAKVKYTLADGVDSQIKADDSDESILTGLSRGAYTITEVADDYYSLDSVAGVAPTNCKAEVSNDKVLTFTMGTDKDGNKVLKGDNKDTVNGQIGVAEFTNKKSVVDIDFEKVDIQTTGTKLPGAEFALYKADADGNKIGNPVGTYTSSNSATNLGKITIENLPVGEYVLIETKSPTGYLCSAIPWKIEVAKNRTITVTYNGNLVKTRVDGEKTIYQLTNTKVYSLPSTGGSGIYWYMIGGMVLMSTAAWILYKNKCREVLGK